MPKLAVVIPTLNEEKYLPALLDDLDAQEFRDFEVIVADAESEDGTVEVAANRADKIVKGGLPSVGRNLGAKAVADDTEYVLFLDSDVRVGTKFLKNIVQAADKGSVDIANGYYGYGNNVWENFMHFNWNIAAFFSQFSKRPWCSGQMILVRRSIFDKLGGFRVDLETSEDFDVVSRAKKAGYKYAVLPCYFEHSKRRFEAMGYFRVFLAYILSTIFVLIGVAGAQKYKDIIRKLNGGWGKW